MINCPDACLPFLTSPDHYPLRTILSQFGLCACVSVCACVFCWAHYFTRMGGITGGRWVARLTSHSL